MDLKQKINLPLYYPIYETNDRRSMLDVSRTAAIQGDVYAYSPLHDEFSMPMSQTEIENIGVNEKEIEYEDPETFEITTKTVRTDFEPANVLRYRLKEEYFFDRQRSELDVRTIGFCPILEVYDQDGEFKGEQAKFWIYYPSIRKTFATVEVFNPQNNSARMTIEDVFWSRRFSTYIFKESNTYDRNIDDYKEGIDALLESQRIHEEIRDWEQDLWEY